MSNSRVMRAALAATGFLAVSTVVASAGATLTTFTNEGAFNTAVSGVTLSTESFETLSAGNNGVGSIDFGDVTASVATGTIFGSNSGSLVTLGTTALNWQQNADGDITFTFDTPINAFSIDVRDFGALTISNTLVVTVGGGTPFNVFENNTDSSAQLFLGLFDDMATFSTVSFSDTATSADGIGLDRLQYGALPNTPTPAPEPATGAMLAVALAGLGVLHLRRRKTAR